MVLVRYVLQTRWGKVNEVVAALKETQTIIAEHFGQARILTDLSGPLHTVVQEFEVDSLARWEQRRAELFARPDYQARVAHTAELIESGRTEFYTIEA